MTPGGGEGIGDEPEERGEQRWNSKGAGVRGVKPREAPKLCTRVNYNRKQGRVKKDKKLTPRVKPDKKRK